MILCLEVSTLGKLHLPCHRIICKVGYEFSKWVTTFYKGSRKSTDQKYLPLSPCLNAQNVIYGDIQYPQQTIPNISDLNKLQPFIVSHNSGPRETDLHTHKMLARLQASGAQLGSTISAHGWQFRLPFCGFSMWSGLLISWQLCPEREPPHTRMNFPRRSTQELPIL